jgi:hypothetical protein
MTYLATDRPSSTLPDVWGPALRIVASPVYGPFSIHANLATGGYDAFPMDITRASREGLHAFYAEDVATLVEGVHNWR